MDPNIHKEFSFSHDGTHVAAGGWKLGSREKAEVIVVRVTDHTQYIIPPHVPYDFGGKRLDVDPASQTLFTGAYDGKAVAAFEFGYGDMLWERRDIRNVSQLVYDPQGELVYCLLAKGATLLTAADGKNYQRYQSLVAMFFGKNSEYSIFDTGKVLLKNRSSDTECEIQKRSGNVLSVAFSDRTAVVSWVSGPLVAYDLENGSELWEYASTGTHVFEVAVASDGESVWVAEQPGYKEPPWQRLRLLSQTGKVQEEIRCQLGHSYGIAPYVDSVIRGDLVITPIGQLRREYAGDKS